MRHNRLKKLIRYTKKISWDRRNESVEDRLNKSAQSRINKSSMYYNRLNKSSME